MKKSKSARGGRWKRWREWEPDAEQLKASSSYLLGLSAVAVVSAVALGWDGLQGTGARWLEFAMLAGSGAVLFFLGMWLLEVARKGDSK